MKKIFSALLFFSLTISNAQIIFEKGYFINNDGIRIECFIENEDWNSNPKSFEYKFNLNDKNSKTENIYGVREFGIDNESMYRRFTVNLERSETLTSRLQKSKNPVWKSETLFLHALVTGNANLYSYVDDNITKYFFETKTKPIEQLVYIRYIDQSGTKDGVNSYAEGIQENNSFRQQLLNNTKCANMTEDEFRKLLYTSNALTRHFVAYNSCTDTGIKNEFNYVANKNKREKFALRAVAGIYQAKASISDPNNTYNASTDMDQVIFKIGFDAEYILPFNKGAWSLFINPGYQKFTATENYDSANGTVINPVIHYTAKADYSSIELPLGVRHYFAINGSSKIFANLAYVIDFSKSGSKIDFSNSDNVVNANKSLPIQSRNNIALGLGYSYRSFSGEIRYNFQRELSNYLLWSAKYSSVGFNFGYKIL